MNNTTQATQTSGVGGKDEFGRDLRNVYAQPNISHMTHPNQMTHQGHFGPQPFAYPYPPMPYPFYPPYYSQMFPPHFSSPNVSRIQRIDAIEQPKVEISSEPSRPPTTQTIPTPASTVGERDPRVKDLFDDILKELTLEELIDSMHENQQKSRTQKFIFKSYDSLLDEICRENAQNLTRESIEDLNNDFIRHQHLKFFEFFGVGEGTDIHHDYQHHEPRDHISLEKVSVMEFCLEVMVRELVRKFVIETVKGVNESFLFYTRMKLDGFGSFPDEDNDLNTPPKSLEYFQQEVDLLRRKIESEEEEDDVKEIIQKLEEERKAIFGLPFAPFGSDTGLGTGEEFDSSGLPKQEAFFKNIQFNGFGE